MNWENECINQIEDQHLKGILLLTRISFLYDHLLMKLLKPYEVSVEQFNILNILRGNYPKNVSLKRIQFNLVNQTKNTTRLVEKLKIKGLVYSQINPVNRRQLDIKISPKGLELLSELEQPFQDLLKKFKALIDEDEMGDVIVHLSKLLPLDELKS